MQGCVELRNHLAVEELHEPALLDFEFEFVSAHRSLTLAGQPTPARAYDALTDFGALTIHRGEAGDALRRREYSLPENQAAVTNYSDSRRCVSLGPQ